MIKIAQKLGNKTAWAILLAMAVVGLALALTGCMEDNHGSNGRPGTVTDRDFDPSYTTGTKSHRVHHDADYDLMITPSDGSEPYWIDVGHSVYDHCYRGSAYPKCVKN